MSFLNPDMDRSAKLKHLLPNFLKKKRGSPRGMRVDLRFFPTANTLRPAAEQTFLELEMDGHASGRLSPLGLRLLSVSKSFSG